MNLITIEESAWKALMEQLQSIENRLKQESIEWDSLWLNQKEICQYLHLSEKTLWRMRRRNEITIKVSEGQFRSNLKMMFDMVREGA
ncbi:MAG: helix-turn-helix domain-containing protein, partial [Capnocytophaga granulosa]